MGIQTVYHKLQTQNLATRLHYHNKQLSHLSPLYHSSHHINASHSLLFEKVDSKNLLYTRHLLGVIDISMNHADKNADTPETCFPAGGKTMNNKHSKR